MNDTSPKMKRMQFEIYQSKSIDEKFRMVTEMMEFGIVQTQNVLKQWHPKKTPNELKIEFFKTYYQNDFSSEMMAMIISKMRNNLM